MVIVSAALLGCPQGATEPPTDTGALEPDPDPARAKSALCSASSTFADYAWVPDDARLTTAIRRDDPELPAALDVLASVTEESGAQLPFSASMSYRNLGLQLANLDHMLAELELAPGELVELHSPAGEFVWLWPTDCPRATVAARALDRFGVMLRADLERPGLRLGAGSAERFPFDLVTLGERHVGLTMLGHGPIVGAWLRDTAHGSDEGPGALLAEISLAPIRSVLGGEALLTNPSDEPSPGLEHRQLRITAEGWGEI